MVRLVPTVVFKTNGWDLYIVEPSLKMSWTCRYMITLGWGDIWVVVLSFIEVNHSLSITGLSNWWPTWSQPGVKLQPPRVSVCPPFLPISSVAIAAGVSGIPLLRILLSSLPLEIRAVEYSMDRGADDEHGATWACGVVEVEGIHVACSQGCPQLDVEQPVSMGPPLLWPTVHLAPAA